jgi:5'(3')-deoxyribonucleotidase
MERLSDTTRKLLARPTIAVDMDHVMADTGAHLCEWLNLQYGSTHVGETFPSLLATLSPERRHAVVEYVTAGEMMRDLPVMSGCTDVLRDLSERYAVVICTAAMEFPRTIPPKIAWLNTRFPFLDPQLFVFCGYKQIMGTDYLIDDSPKHFDGFKGTPLLYSAIHNRDVDDWTRVGDWAEIAAYFAGEL